MFLTKKSFRKILIMAICFSLLGSIFIAFSILFNIMNISDNSLLISGIIIYLLNVLMIFLKLYDEGKGKLIILANKLVRKKLKPAEFILHYESLKKSNDLIIKKPSIKVLQFVALAYDSLDDRENALATVDEMIEISNEKRKPFSNLIKCSFLFSYGEFEEAELLFNKTQKQKLNIMCNSLVDAILNSDRAMAMGDYKTVEAYSLRMLERSFPKLDNLGKLVVHYTLGKVYEKLQDNSKAITNYQYCVDFGGETAIKITAIKKLQHIK
ncbi:MAG: hypothetical protein IJP34_00285 [Clostridia bacterium]|nr:hypothetical protein [Clostridia bacterium]